MLVSNLSTESVLPSCSYVMTLITSRDMNLTPPIMLPPNEES